MLLTNKLTNGNLINKRKNRELNSKFSYQLEMNLCYLLGLSVTLILLTVNEGIEERSNVPSPFLG